jgi:hypothetical protein
MTNEFLILAFQASSIAAPFAAALGMFIMIFDVLPPRGHRPKPNSNRLLLISFLLILLPSCLSLLLRLAIA